MSDHFSTLKFCMWPQFVCGLFWLWMWPFFKWSDKIALFLIILGFYRGFLRQCSILIPTPLYHVALPHLKTILKSRTVAPKLFCIGLPLFEARYRKWSSLHKKYDKNVRLAWTHSTPLNFFLEEGRGRPRKEQRG